MIKSGYIQPSTNVNSVSVNDNYTKLLVNFSDRVLRLYNVHYPKKNSKGSEETTFELIDSFTDVINHNRWLNTQFLRLGEKTKIISQTQTNDYLLGL